MSTTLEQWAAWIAGETGPRSNEDVCRTARHQVLAYAASAAGASRALPPLRAHAARVADAGGGARALGPAPDALALLRTTPGGALRHGLLAGMALDHEDYLWLGHTGHSAVGVPTALGQGHAYGDVLEAVVVANEIGGRLAASAALGPLNGQMWSFLHVAGSIAAAARLAGDPPKVIAHALALGLSHPPFPSRGPFLGSTAKWATALGPTLWGLEALEVARAGVEGPLDLLERSDGFYEHHAWMPMRGMLGELGRVWVTQTVALKPWPGCAYVTGAVEGALRLREQLNDGAPFEPDAILALTLRMGGISWVLDRLVPPDAWAPDDAGNPVPITFSPRLSLAHALLAATGAGGPTAADFAPDRLGAHGAAIRAVADRVDARHDATLTRQLVTTFAHALSLTGGGGSLVARLATLGTQGLGMAQLHTDRVRYPFGLDIDLVTTDGRHHGVRVVHPSGTPGAEAWLEVARPKALRELGPALGDANAERLTTALLEGPADTKLGKLLAE